MKKVTTKSERNLVLSAYERWLKSTDTELWHVYGSFSEAKAKAMEYCRNLMDSLDGRDLRIISHNTNEFTVGFEFPDGETGELNFMYITKSYDRYITL